MEPRLSGAKWRPCSGPECGRTAIDDHEPCPEPIETQAQAVDVLASRRRCTDAAIAALEHFARTDARAWSDLAGAYYLRAHRDQRPSDFLAALRTANRAVRWLPDDPEARFNLALIEETLGLRVRAAQSWDALVKMDHSDWGKEAAEHLRRLRMPDAATQWRTMRVELQKALHARNAAAVRALIEDYPTAAREYLEKEQDTKATTLLASQLSLRLGGDESILDSRFTNELSAALFSERGLTVLTGLEQEARNHRYDYLLARVREMRAHVLDRESRYLEALSNYKAALDTFSRLGDLEAAASIQRSRVGIYRTMGQWELAFGEGMEAMKHFPRIVDARRRQMTLLEIAMTAAELGYPDEAILYKDAAIALLQKELQWIPPDRKDEIALILRLLAASRRTRAEIALQADRYDDAQRDLDEAARLTEGTDPKTRQAREALRIRIQRVRGALLLRLDPNGASRAFTEALQAIPEDDIKTLRASLYAQRAEAERRAGRSDEQDLQNALRELREEERRLLAARERGSGEELWNAYFARFEETYDRLVARFAEAGRWDEAFTVDERSRAIEPLDLIRKLEGVPPAFEALVPRGEPMSLEAIRRQLPAGTVVLHYAVLEDRTLLWIVRRESIGHLRLETRRTDVQRWSETLQRAARRWDRNGFERVAKAAFEGLLAEPLRQVGPKPSRIVIIPDGPMHGIPFAGLYDAAAGQYLIEKAPIETAGSATLYVFSRMRDAVFPRAPRPALLLIGDPEFEAVDLARGMKQLPYAREEVARIRELYAPRANVILRIGSDATVETFFESARNKSVIHVAAHSIVNPRQPSQSVLLLAKSGEHSGAVNAAELVRRLSLDQTRLVVLASCSSAGGLPIGPEGVAPLVRPLLTAGVPGVVGSLWDVQDATAETLSVSFHRHYGQGLDAAKALQAAQLEMLRSGTHDLHSILAWAPFQVIGHASSPFGATPLRINGGTVSGIHRTHSFHRDDGLHPQQ